MFAAPPAKAQAVWSATLVVKNVHVSSRHGCNNIARDPHAGLPVSAQWCSTPSTLSDDDFSVGGQNYQVVSLQSNKWGFRITFTGGPPDDAFKALNVCVGTAAFSLSSLEELSHDALGDFERNVSFSPANSNFAWSPFDRVSLKIGLGSTCSDRLPNAPWKITVTPGDGKLTLRWNAPANTPNLAGYDVQYRISDGGWIAHGDSRSRETTRVIDLGLIPPSDVHVRVRTRFRGGTSEWIAWPVGTAAPPPTDAERLKPAGLRVTLGNQRLTLRWTAPVTAAGDRIVGYDVNYRRSDGSWIRHGTRDSSTRSRETTRVIDLGLIPPTDVQARVRARVRRPGRTNDLVGYWATWRGVEARLRQLGLQE